MNNKNLETNIIKYNLFKIFTKRVYLPLIAIYLIDVGHVSLAQLGIIGSANAIINLLLEVPTGYFADRWGHKKSIVFGSFIMAISVLPYIFYPGFIGGLIGSIGYFAGSAFTSGTMQAFMHETLMALGRDSEYSKIMGKAQSFGLVGNVILIALVPLSYQIDHRLPFIIGFICLLMTAVVAVTFVNPPQRITLSEDRKNMFQVLGGLVRQASWLKMLVLFMIFGVVSASFDQSGIYREVAFRSMNIPVVYFGFILALGSLLAAITGVYIHLLDKLSTKRFLYFDILYLVVVFILVGASKIPALIILGFVLMPTYDRTRNIIYEAKLFKEFALIKHKATLISVQNFFAYSNGIWIPLLLSFFVRQVNVFLGHAIFGIAMLLVLIPLALLHGKLKAVR